MTTLETVLRRASDVRYRILDDEGVVIRQREGEVLGLNSLGARLLESLDGVRSTGQIVDSLADEYEVDHELFATDSLAFFEEMVDAGIAEVVREGGTG